MGAVALLACVTLASVFVVSGIAKLLDPGGTRQAVSGFGVPERLVPATAVVLAPAELLVAALLLPRVTAVAGLVLALLLLATFTGAVILALRTGRRPDCHCFGRIGGADVSGRTVARNIVLAALAVVGMFAATRTGTDLSSTEATVAVVAGLVLAGLVILVEGLAGRAARRGRERAAETEYERGMADEAAVRLAPPFEAATLSGEQTSLRDLLAQSVPLLLVFLSPGCGPCNTMRPSVTRWAEAYRERLTVAVVASGGEGRNLETYDGVPPRVLVILDDEDTIRENYGVRGTPAGVLVHVDGRLGGGIASGERLVRRLLVAALAGGESHEAQQDAEDGGVPAEFLDLASIPRPRLTVTVHEREGETILVDEAEASSISLDPVGGIVWSVLDGESPLDEIVSDLAEVFAAPVEVVGPDVLEMVRTLGRAGMLEGVIPDSPSEEVEPTHHHAHTH